MNWTKSKKWMTGKTRNMTENSIFRVGAESVYLHYSLTGVKAAELMAQVKSVLCPGETPQYVDLTFVGHHQCTQAI